MMPPNPAARTAHLPHTTGPHAADLPSSAGTRSTALPHLAARLLHRLLPAIPRASAHRLGHRNVYILPTISGMVFAALLVVLLLASINYRLGLGYGLTFLLAGVGLASVGMTHANLRGLTLTLRSPGPAFAGTPADVELRLENPGRTRHGVALRWRGNPAPPAWADLSAASVVTVGMRFVPAARGWQDLPPLVVETRFPFGFMRAWTVWQPAAQVLVWPRPEPAPPAVPLQHRRGVEAGTPALRGEPDPGFNGLRPWRSGDPARDVAWRHWARSGGAELLSRDAAATAGSALWLAWHDAGPASADAESRLSRLTAWVELAHAQGRAVGLRLPGRQIAPAAGDAHRLQLLETLALWP